MKPSRTPLSSNKPNELAGKSIFCLWSFYYGSSFWLSELSHKVELSFQGNFSIICELSGLSKYVLFLCVKIYQVTFLLRCGSSFNPNLILHKVNVANIVNYLSLFDRYMWVDFHLMRRLSQLLLPAGPLYCILVSSSDMKLQHLSALSHLLPACQAEKEQDRHTLECCGFDHTELLWL